MNRSAMYACVVLVLAAGAAAQDWSDWPYVRGIELEATAATRLVSVPLPPAIHARTGARLNDLRLLDDRDREVPFLIHVPRGTHRRDWRPARLLEASVLPGAYTQIVLEAGMPGTLHDLVELTIRDADFFAWVEVAASSDGTTWRILDERLPLYRFAAEGHRGTQILRHAPSTSRFLRLRLQSPDGALTVTDARIGEEVNDPPLRVDLPALALVSEENRPDRHTAWQADFGGAAPASAVLFDTTEPEFHRSVRVLASDDGRRWRPAGGGEIYRLRRGAATLEQVEIAFDETTSRYLRAEVFNRHDPPVPDLSATFRGVPRYVVFRQEPERTYRLLYGARDVDAPGYELARLVTATEIRDAAAGRMGSERLMPGHPRPLPWTERHAVVLWLSVALALGVLAWLAFRSMRPAEESDQRPG